MDNENIENLNDAPNLSELTKSAEQAALQKSGSPVMKILAIVVIIAVLAGAAYFFLM